MSIFGTSALDEKKRELSQLQKDYETKIAHKQAIQDMLDACKRTVDGATERHREDTKELEGRILELETALERKSNDIGNLHGQLEYERSNRQTLIDAKVQETLGQYETRYYHDLHTFMENHTTKFNDFQMKFMEQTLNAIKEMKPVEPKLTVLTTEGKINNSCSSSN